MQEVIPEKGPHRMRNESAEVAVTLWVCLCQHPRGGFLRFRMRRKLLKLKPFILALVAPPGLLRPLLSLFLYIFFISLIIGTILNNVNLCNLTFNNKKLTTKFYIRESNPYIVEKQKLSVSRWLNY